MVATRSVDLFFSLIVLIQMCRREYGQVLGVLHEVNLSPLRIELAYTVVIVAGRGSVLTVDMSCEEPFH
jgi:hypothetical protein